MLKGLIPVLLTPMTAKHEIDDVGLGRLFEYLFSNNITGVWALGSASEEINIGFEKKIQVANLVSEFCENKNFKVIMGTGCVSLDDHFKFIDMTSSCQFTGIHILPYDLKMGQARVINLFEKIADYSPWPVWMYHNPKRGRAFEFETINVLSKHHNIGGIKIGGYNLTEISRCFDLKSGNFEVVAAGSGQLYSCLALGAEAHTSSEGCVYPELFSRIFALFRKGNLTEALKLQKQWVELNSKVIRTSNGEHAAEEKFLLSLLGICDPFVNPNYEVYPKEHRAHLIQTHQDILQL